MTTSRWSRNPVTPAVTDVMEPPPSAAIARWAAPTSVTMSPRFQASRTPSGARSGKLELDEVGQARHRPCRDRRPVSAMRRVGGQGLCPGGRHVHPFREAGGLDDRFEEPRLLADRFDEEDPFGRQHGRDRQARVPAAGAEIEDAPDPPFTQDRYRGEAVEDVGPGHLDRVADRRQVDGGRPGEQQADVIVDGRPGRRRQLQTELGEAGVQGEAVLEWELGKAFDARRERLTHAVQGTPPDRSRAVSSRGATPGVGIVAHRGREDRSSAVRPVRGRVSPDPSRTALPCLPQCGCRTLRRGRAGVNAVIHELPAGQWIGGKLLARNGPVSPNGPLHGPDGRASGARRR